MKPRSRVAKLNPRIAFSPDYSLVANLITGGLAPPHLYKQKRGVTGGASGAMRHSKWLRRVDFRLIERAAEVSAFARFAGPALLRYRCVYSKRWLE